MELRLESSITINKPIGEVFAAWAEIERFTEWWDLVQERRKLTEGPVGVGTKYHAVDSMPPGRRLESSLEITTYEPNNQIGGRLAGAVNGTWVAQFQEAPSGTRMTFLTVASLSGVLGILATLMKGQIRRNDQRALERFKASLEGAMS